ncbi:MAG: hypothetical protein KDA84_06895, partial [Planctomycetaceae bacterium]|nr:hypothetical protein [Planctomycetaceae bacterium]
MPKRYALDKPIENYLPASLWTPFWVPPLLFLGLVGVCFAVRSQLTELSPAVYFSPVMLCSHALTLTLLVCVVLDSWKAASHLRMLDSKWIQTTIENAQLIANPRYQKEAFERGLQQLLDRSQWRWVWPILLAAPITIAGLYAYVNAARLPDATPEPWLLVIGAAEFMSVVVVAVVVSQWYRSALSAKTNAIAEGIH